MCEWGTAQPFWGVLYELSNRMLVTDPIGGPLNIKATSRLNSDSTSTTYFPGENLNWRTDKVLVGLSQKRIDKTYLTFASAGFLLVSTSPTRNQASLLALTRAPFEKARDERPPVSKDSGREVTPWNKTTLVTSHSRPSFLVQMM